MTQVPIYDLERELAALHQRRHCILTGRATTALYLIFSSLPQAGGKIVFPAILCPSPANAALYAGYEPIFCDVLLKDANMDPDALGAVLRSNDDVVAVVVAHLYGQPADMQRLSEITHRYGVMLIEDIAQAMGGDIGGKPLGSFGDVAVLSFGHTKIIDAGHGGALLTDDAKLASQFLEMADHLPLCPDTLLDLVAEYGQVYYKLMAMAEASERLHQLFLPLPEMYRELYIYKFNPNYTNEIKLRLENLADEVEARRYKAQCYAEQLMYTPYELLNISEGGVPWRFNLILPEGSQKQITEKLRQNGVHASNWYPSLTRWFASGRKQDPSLFANASTIEESVLNLWLDPTTDIDSISHCCDVLHDLSEQISITAQM